MSAEGAEMPVSVVAAGMVIGAVSLMILGVQPVLLGALAEANRISHREVGQLATVEVLALAVGSALGPHVLRRGAMRLKTGSMATFLAGIDLAVWTAPSPLILEVLRGCAGLLEGLILGAAILVTIRSARPDRMNAIFLGLSTIPQAILAFLLPAAIIPQSGSNGGFVILAMLAALAAIASAFLVDRVPEPSTQPVPKAVWSLPVIVALIAAFLQNVAIGGAWDYLQLLSDQHHFNAGIAGAAIAGGLTFQVAGAFAAAAWGGRARWLETLVIGSVAQGFIVFALVFANTPALYICLVLAFGLFWLALTPFQVRMLISLDETRSAVLMLTATTLLGLSIGPAVSAMGVRGANVDGAFRIAAAAMSAAACLYGCLTARQRLEIHACNQLDKYN